MNELFSSTGTLKYDIIATPEQKDFYRLIVEIDQGISEYYRALVPKHITLLPQRYGAHISVVRKEVPKNLTAWGKRNGDKIGFQYSPYVHFGKVYAWLNVYSKEIEQVRIELGLTPFNDITKPPDKESCYHTTIGNFKYLQEK